MWRKDWGANGLNSVKHSFATKMVPSTITSPVLDETDATMAAMGVGLGGDLGQNHLQKAVKDKIKGGNCFGYSMKWCRMCLRGNQPASKDDFVENRDFLIASQAMQSWIVRERGKGNMPGGMYGMKYNQSMAECFGLQSQEIASIANSGKRAHTEWLDSILDDPGYYVISFSFSKGAHAISAKIAADEYLLFDPNNGQYSCNDRDEFRTNSDKGLGMRYALTKFYVNKVAL